MSMTYPFDPDFASPVDWARAYRDLRLNVVPAVQASKTKKHPIGGWKEFQASLTPDVVFERWYGQRGDNGRNWSMGFLTGPASLADGAALLLIDIDVKDEKRGLHTWRAWLDEHENGIDVETWRAKTGSGGIHLFFRYPASLTIHNTQETFEGIDVRAQGGFVMAAPSPHYIRGTFYEWDLSPWDTELADAPDWLLGICQAIGQEEDEYKREPRAQAVRVEAVEEVNAFGKKVNGREKYMTRVIWGAVLDMRRDCPIRPPQAESEQRMLEAFEVYLSHVKTRLPTTNADGLEAEGRGIGLFREKWTAALRQWDSKVAIEAGKPKPLPLPEAVSAGTRVEEVAEDAAPSVDGGDLIPIVPAFPIDPTAIPVRPWIVPGVLLRGLLSFLVAPPGSGKSLLTLQMAIMLATGTAWAGWKPRQKCRVLVINTEDDPDEMRRRLAAALAVMKISQEEVAQSLFLAETPENIVVAKADARTKTVVRTPLVERLARTIEANQIDVVVVDPFAETFEGDENSNSEVKWAGVIWRDAIARKTQCSVMLVHHTRKYANGMAGDADAMRGGGALTGVARVVSTLFTMTEDEATAMNVDPSERTRYVRFDDAKANMFLVTGAARWFQKRTVSLPNGAMGIPGDDVGALEPWSPPGLFDGFSVELINRALDRIDRGEIGEDHQPTGYRFSIQRNTGSRHASKPIAEILGCTEQVAKRIIRQWVEAGVLVEEEYQTPDRNKRFGVLVDRSKRPGMVS